MTNNDGGRKIHEHVRHGIDSIVQSCAGAGYTHTIAFNHPGL